MYAYLVGWRGVALVLWTWTRDRLRLGRPTRTDVTLTLLSASVEAALLYRYVFRRWLGPLR